MLVVDDMKHFICNDDAVTGLSTIILSFLNFFMKKPESDPANPLRKLKRLKSLSFNERRESDEGTKEIPSFGLHLLEVFRRHFR